MENFDQLQNLLEQKPKILITAHANPDGDAIGSALSLYHFFKQEGHQVRVIMPTAMPEFMDWMPGFEDIFIYEQRADVCKKIIQNATLIYCLDYNSFKRTEHMQHALNKATAFKVMIDHHMMPEDFSDARLWRTTSSSTCELIYDYFELMKVLDKVPMTSFECMYVGILTDTGRFQHATNPHLFRIVADLTERGLNTNKITNLITNSYSYKRFNLLGYSIYERLEFLDDINTALIVLDQEDHRKFTISRGDLEGVVNFALRIRSVRCAILVTERKDRIKLSMRSKGDFSVQEICSKYFNGGGHLNASGGQTRDSLADTVKKLREVLYNEYKEALTQ